MAQPGRGVQHRAETETYQMLYGGAAR